MSQSTVIKISNLMLQTSLNSMSCSISPVLLRRRQISGLSWILSIQEPQSISKFPERDNNFQQIKPMPQEGAGRSWTTSWSYKTPIQPIKWILFYSSSNNKSTNHLKIMKLVQVEFCLGAENPPLSVAFLWLILNGKR